MKPQRMKFVLMAQQMDRAEVFYRDAMGLVLAFSSPHWTELTHGDAVLARTAEVTARAEPPACHCSTKKLAKSLPKPSPPELPRSRRPRGVKASQLSSRRSPTRRATRSC